MQTINYGGHLAVAIYVSFKFGSCKSRYAEECKECTKLAIQVFTNHDCEASFLLSLLSNLETNPTDVAKVFLSVTLRESVRNHLSAHESMRQAGNRETNKIVV